MNALIYGSYCLFLHTQAFLLEIDNNLILSVSYGELKATTLAIGFFNVFYISSNYLNKKVVAICFIIALHLSWLHIKLLFQSLTITIMFLGLRLLLLP